LNVLFIYLVPLAVLLLAAGAVEERRTARAATIALVSLAVVMIVYGAAGFGFQFGGIGLINDAEGLQALVREWSPLDTILGSGWGFLGLDAFGINLVFVNQDITNLYMYHAALAATAVLMPVLALAARVRSRVLVIGAALLGIFFYPMAANWVWGGGWLQQFGLTSALGHGMVDFAGSGVVYMFGGFATLGALLGYGVRSHTGVTTSANIPEFPSAHLPLFMILGSFLFLIGSSVIVFGDPFQIQDLPATLIQLNLVNAAMAGLVVATLYGWFVSGEPLAMLAARGAVAGVVAVSASLPFIPAWTALVIGGIAGLLLPLTTYAVERWIRADDRALLVPTFGVAGLWGLIALAIFADGTYGVGWNKTGVEQYLGVAGQGVTGIFAQTGFVPDSPGQMEAQFFGVVAIGLLAFIASFAVFFTLRRIGGPPE
jgi:Amt family ammonium transporter